MSKALSTGTIGEDLRSNPDYMFYAETVPSNTTSNSAGLLLGKVQNALDIICVVNEEISVADTKAITFNIQQSSDNGVADAYTTIATPYSLTSDGGDTIAAGTQLFRYTVSTDKEIYIRVAFVSTDTGEDGSVDVYPVYISR